MRVGLSATLLLERTVMPGVTASPWRGGSQSYPEQGERGWLRHLGPVGADFTAWKLVRVDVE